MHFFFMLNQKIAVWKIILVRVKFQLPPPYRSRAVFSVLPLPLRSSDEFSKENRSSVFGKL